MAADGNFSIDPATAAIGSSIGTALLAWLGTRLVGKAAIQTAVATTFEKQIAGYDSLLDQYKDALREATTERDEARGEAMTLRAELRQRDAIIAGFERTKIMPHGKGKP